MPVLEALSSGLKVIVTEGGSTDDFVGEERDGIWKVKAEVKVVEGVQRAKNGQKGAFKVEGYEEDELFVEAITKELVVDEESLILAMASSMTTVETGKEGLRRAAKVAREYSWDTVAERLVEEGLRLGRGTNIL